MPAASSSRRNSAMTGSRGVPSIFSPRSRMGVDQSLLSWNGALGDFTAVSMAASQSGDELQREQYWAIPVPPDRPIRPGCLHATALLAGLEPPEPGGVAPEDLLPVRGGEEGDLLADQVQLLLERRPASLGAGGAGEPGPPQEAVRPERLVEALDPREGVLVGVLPRRR